MVSKGKPRGGTNTPASITITTDFDVSKNCEKGIERRLALLGTVDVTMDAGLAVVQEEAPPVADLLDKPVVCVMEPPPEEPVVEPETPAPVWVVKALVMNPRPIMLEKNTDAKPTAPKAVPSAAMGKNALLVSQVTN